MLLQIVSTLPRRLRRVSRWLAAPALAITLAACGGGGGGSSMTPPSTGPQGCTSTSCGSALVTLTDASGPFTSYTVDVTSLQLTKANGAVVETLPTKTTVDLAQLVNLSELLTAATIPNGEYVAAQMTVNYAGTGDGVYVNVNGTSTKANVVDINSSPLTTATLTVRLDNQHHLFIAPGVPARLALDFNLTDSNTVNTTATPPTVTPALVIVASVVPSDTRDIRVRGALAGVDTMTETFTVNLRPFDDHDGNRGQIVVNTTAQTTFEVSGVSYNSQVDGINAMARLAAGAMTIAFGTLSTTDQRFTAARVLAGTSVETPSLDRLQGVVIKRTDDSATGVATLVVRGANLHSHITPLDWFSAKDVTLTIGPSTAFTAAGDPSAKPDRTWPSIGSEITAFGTAGADPANPTFDATVGRVRLEITTLWGLPAAPTSTCTPTPAPSPVPASTPATGEVVLNLQAIEGFAPSVFSFTGTGKPKGTDSNPACYVVTTGILPLTSIGASAPLRFFGLVQPFGSAPPDFNASTLINFAAVAAELAVGFGDGSTAAFGPIATGTDLTLNLADPMLGTLHVIRIGPQIIDLTKLPANALSLTISADTAGPDTFAIRTDGMTATPGAMSVYGSFTDFESALKTALSTAKVLRVLGTGQYDPASNTFTARQLVVLLHG
jgi:hypothetical protein